MNHRAKNDQYVVPSADQAVKILKFLAESDKTVLSLSEICTQVDINKSKAFTILNTLQKHELIEKRGQRGGYSLGSGLVRLSRSYLDNLDAGALAKPILEELAEAFSCTAALGIAKEKYSYIAAKADPKLELNIVTVSIGQQFPIDMGSHGIAVASVLSDDEVETMLSKEYPLFYGKPRRFGDDEFKRQLAFCRENGYSYEIGYILPKLNGVSSPVVNSKKTAFGYIIVFGLFEEKDLEEIGRMTSEGAKKLSKQLG